MDNNAKHKYVTIPDDLADRMDRLNPPLNKKTIEEVCMTALEAVVRIGEIYQKKTPDIGLALERLTVEWGVTKTNSHQWGYSDGYSDATSMSYRDLHHLSQRRGEIRSGNFEAIMGSSPCVNLVLSHIEEQEKTAKDFNKSGYLEGWIDGVIAFYDRLRIAIEKVKDKGTKGANG